ncbi:hypothetical protein [Sorangium sp. So ce426]|uniref:hypothetical protein n=1 Tax=unclassified Sorangium TaxID=2621164 RepID=UPI003F5BDE61
MTSRPLLASMILSLLTVAACGDYIYGDPGGGGGTASTATSTAMGATGGGDGDAGTTTTGAGGEGASGGGEASGGGGGTSTGGGDATGGGGGTACGDAVCGTHQVCESCQTDDEGEPPWFFCTDADPEPSADEFRCGETNCDRGTEACEHKAEYLGCDGHDICTALPAYDGCTDCDCIAAYFADGVNGSYFGEGASRICLDACTGSGEGAIHVRLSACWD